MFEDRDKKIKKYNSSIEKKSNIITHKKIRLSEMMQNKVVAMFKNKFDIDKIKVEFSEEDKNRYSSYAVTPDLVINYDEYNFKINHEGNLVSISNWYGFRKENRDDWYDYLAMLGTLSSYMKNKKPIYTFVLGKMQELDTLIEELYALEKEAKKFKDETKELKKNNFKGIIASLIKEGMRFNFDSKNTAYINSYSKVSIIEIEAIKNKTYKCSIYGQKNERFSYTIWHDIYIKHDYLHSLLLNKQDQWSTNFKRKFNLEISIDD